MKKNIINANGLVAGANEPKNQEEEGDDQNIVVTNVNTPQILRK
jgi:hypothetical protein